MIKSYSNRLFDTIVKSNMEARRDYSLKRIIKKILLLVQKWPIWPGQIRYRILKMTGMDIAPCYIGANVSFDGIRPDLIKIGRDTVITQGTIILSHFYDTSIKKFVYGNVLIGDNTFIGMNTLIVKPVTIGSNVTIGAGSIVTKNINDNEIWAGNPAKFIKKSK